MFRNHPRPRELALIAGFGVYLRRNILDTLLLLIALVGLVLVWQTAREQAPLRAKIARFSQSAGDLTITDPSKVHVLALDTGEPLHFAWRVYLPANYRLIEHANQPLPTNVLGPSSDPAREIVIRVRIREDAQGDLNLYQSLEQTSQRGRFGRPELAKILHGRFDKVLVEQLGVPKAITARVNERLDVLRLKLPANMEAEYLEALLPQACAQHDPELYRLTFGPAPATPAPGPPVQSSSSEAPYGSSPVSTNPPPAPPVGDPPP